MQLSPPLQSNTDVMFRDMLIYCQHQVPDFTSGPATTEGGRTGDIYLKSLRAQMNKYGQASCAKHRYTTGQRPQDKMCPYNIIYYLTVSFEDFLQWFKHMRSKYCGYNIWYFGQLTVSTSKTVAVSVCDMSPWFASLVMLLTSFISSKG